VAINYKLLCPCNFSVFYFSWKVNSGLINNIEVVCPSEKRRPKVKFQKKNFPNSGLLFFKKVFTYKFQDIKRNNKILTVRQFAETNGLPVHNWPLERKK
jgi:hypothetical protein